jgi:UDP-N-acetylglucosamine--N-acetylmuramyl-(pentapeptide) pyrophosphoryl-undecaprenol N-acetylglucosamine transferase
MKVLFGGGGTGGHVYPALSVADELAKRDGDFAALFVGTRAGLEADVVPQTGYDIRFISSRGVRGKGIAGRMTTLVSISIGFFQALKIVTAFGPDVVFGAGGYASAAVVLAASALRRTIVLQEQNSIPGLTNRLLASRAKRVYLGFERARSFMGSHPGVMITGNPLRGAILEPCTVDLEKEFGLERGKPVLLVFGGSQGARSLNKAAVDYLISRENVQGIIQTGKTDYERVKAGLGRARGRMYVSPYISNIHQAYHAADVALARAGALSVSELAAVGLPAVLVPYPYAADDHQVYNAEVLVEAGGSVMLEDSALGTDRLAAELDALLGDRARLSAMRASLLGIARRDAAGEIARDILALCGKGGGDGGHVPADRDEVPVERKNVDG